MFEIDSSGRMHVVPGSPKKEEQMETVKCERIPFEVESVQVTEENMSEVAEWCNGEIVEATRQFPRPNIKVDVLHPAHERQRRAFVGDHVLRTEKGFKIYNDRAYHECFRPVVKLVTNAKPHSLNIIPTDEALPGHEITIVEES